MGDLLPFLGMVLVMLAQVSNMVVSKVAMSRGMNRYVIIVYSDALASLIFLPCSLIFHRSESPPLTLSLLGKFFVLGVFGSSAQIFGYAGIQYSSPTLGTAILNLIPAFTFILAIIFRLEKLDWRSTNSQAKVLGTIVSIAGAFVVTFYKGTPIIMTPSLTVPTRHLLHLLLLSPQLSWILGGFFLVGQALMDSAWFILQAFVLKEFPAVLIIMFYVCLFNTILTAIFSLIAVQDPSAWMLRLDMGLIAILYSAVVGIVFRFSLCTWCLWRTGPLYVSMFKPLAIIFAVIMDAIFLGDALCLGSLIGAIVIVSGFYAVIWGKAKEENTNKDNGVGSFKSSSEKTPLLQSKVEEI